MSCYYIPEKTPIFVRPHATEPEHVMFHNCCQLVTSVMCRNSKYFSDPVKFDPSRFDADKSRYNILYKTLHMHVCTPSHRPGPFVYFPFGLSHRSCIGHHFAMVSFKRHQFGNFVQ